MVEEEKIGLIGQYLIACFQPKNYKKLLTNKKGQTVLYVIVLCIFLAFMEFVLPFAAWNMSVGGVENLITKRIPAFEVKDGMFTIESPVEISMPGLLYVETMPEVEEISTKELKDDYRFEILIGKKNMFVKEANRIFNFPFEKYTDVITNDTLLTLIPTMKLVMVVSFLFYVVRKIGSYLLYTFFFTFICTGGRKVKSIKDFHLKEAFLVTLYAGTLGGILNSMNYSAGFPVDSFYMALIAVTIMMFQIYKAARSLQEDPAE